jgi:glycosyltransferase involved in cell wall biosynthesis
MREAPVVAVWKSRLLPYSETFVRNQCDALRRYTPVAVGALRVDSPLARDTDRIAWGAGPAGRAALLRFKLTGRSATVTDLLADVGPDLVHAHFGSEGWLVSRPAARLGVPLVVTLHGCDVTSGPTGRGPKAARNRWLLRDLFDRADLVIAVSDFIRDRAVALGADPARVVTSYVGIPVPPDPQPVPPEWDVLFVGRLVAAKGVEDVIEAAAMVTSRRRPRCLFIGSGPLKEHLSGLAAARRVDAAFVGARPSAAVSAAMARSRVFVAPSRGTPAGSAEGLGMVFLEAAAHRLPVVAYRHGGVPEAVADGIGGLLCAEGDVPALAANLSRLLDDDGLRERLGHAGRARVVERFDITGRTAALERLYDRVLGATAPAARHPHRTELPA